MYIFMTMFRLIFSCDVVLYIFHRLTYAKIGNVWVKKNIIWFKKMFFVQLRHFFEKLVEVGCMEWYLKDVSDARLSVAL